MRDFSKTAWWGSLGGFFGELYKESDDSFEGVFKNPQELGSRTSEEAKGVARLCELKKGDSILDCPSGYGRHSLALAKMGFNVTGIDINDRFLEISRGEAEKQGFKNCNFIGGDMRFLDFENEFNAAINMFYSFGFFESEDDNYISLENFYKALKPSGKFLMHTHITLPKILGGDYIKHQVRNLKSGNKLELWRDYDPKTKRENGRWSIIYPNGKRKDLTPYSMRIYSTKKWTDLCANVGFREIRLYGDWNGSWYEDNSPQLILVATK